jgi:hypothetical protein
MNYQLSLDPNDQPLAVTDKAEGAEDEVEEMEPTSGSVSVSGSGSGSGSLKQLEWHSSVSD